MRLAERDLPACLPCRATQLHTNPSTSGGRFELFVELDGLVRKGQRYVAVIAKRYRSPLLGSNSSYADSLPVCSGVKSSTQKKKYTDHISQTQDMICRSDIS